MTPTDCCYYFKEILLSTTEIAIVVGNYFILLVYFTLHDHNYCIIAF